MSNIITCVTSIEFVEPEGIKFIRFAFTFEGKSFTLLNVIFI